MKWARPLNTCEELPEGPERPVRRPWLGRKVGLIINERVINVPQRPLNPQTYSSMRLVTRQRTSQQRSSENSSSSRSVILLTRTFFEEYAEPAGVGGGKRKRDAATEMVYPRPEDQFFHKVSKMSFQWKSRELGENDDVDSFQPMRLCMVVDANSVLRSESKSRRCSRVILKLSSNTNIILTQTISSFEPLPHRAAARLASASASSLLTLGCFAADSP